mgnify:CR=1 FL=1
MYIYESHLGGFYESDEDIPFEELYCDECGDSDTLIGLYDKDSVYSATEFIIVMVERCFDTAYIMSTIRQLFDVPKTALVDLYKVVSGLVSLYNATICQNEVVDTDISKETKTTAEPCNYTVHIVETTIRDVNVTAKTEDDARYKVQSMYANSEVVLPADDHKIIDIFI